MPRLAVACLAAALAVWAPLQAAAAPDLGETSAALVALIWVHPDGSHLYSGFYGAVTGRTVVLTVAHGFHGARPGDHVWVATTGYYIKTVGPAPAQLPLAYWREGALAALCPSIDLARVAVPDLPARIRPVPIGGDPRGRLYVLNTTPAGRLRVTDAALTGGEFTGALGSITRPRPAIELRGVRPGHGWSGSPIVTGRGRLVGLVVSGTLTADTTAGIAPSSWFGECR